MIYLASPYTHEDPAVVEQRFKQAEKATAKGLIRGECIYSPIVHCHEIAKDYDLPKTFDFWQKYNYGMLRNASAMYILAIDGYNKSSGVLGEKAMAEQLGIPVKYVDVNFNILPQGD